MGMRTIVLLNNDRQHHWAADSELGDKIVQDQMKLSTDPMALGGNGEVVECCHSSQDSLLFVRHLRAYNLEDSRVYKDGVLANSKDAHEAAIMALKWAAEKLGCKLIRKRKK